VRRTFREPSSSKGVMIDGFFRFSFCLCCTQWGRCHGDTKFWILYFSGV
jgi:hypothetical protein